MFPIRDHNPSGRTPYVVYALMAANILIFVSYVGIMDNARVLQQFYFLTSDLFVDLTGFLVCFQVWLLRGAL